MRDGRPRTILSITVVSLRHVLPPLCGQASRPPGLLVCGRPYSGYGPASPSGLANTTR